MPTKTKLKKWKQEESRMLAAVPPAHLQPDRRPAYILPEEERLSIVSDHLPKLSKTEKDKAVEGIEGAVRKFLIAGNIDDRPLPAHVRVQMERLEEAASNLLGELLDCDSLSWDVITQKAAATPPPPPPPPPPKSKSKVRALADAMYVPLQVEPMDPPDRIIEQLRQYVPLFSTIAKSAGAMSNSRKKGAFLALVGELMSVWSAATSQDCKGNSAFTDFVEAVAKTDPVRTVSPLTEYPRLKIQRVIREISS
jgi:hypothetical protein